MNASTQEGKRIDDNLVLGAGGEVRCRHCGARVGVVGEERYLSQAKHIERSAGAAGPQVREDAHLFVDRDIVLRQVVCPECATALATEVVPRDDDSYRKKAVGW